MAFENRSILELSAIARAGGGFKTNARARSVLELQSLAKAAVEGGAHITLTDLNARSILELSSIATAGRGHVSFED